MSAVSGHPLYYVHSLWSSPVVHLQSGHLLYYVCSLWSSPVVCLQSLVIPVVHLQSLVISCNMSTVSGCNACEMSLPLHGHLL
ncbi:unnamed protein product [Staurois parvus]|uniref:Uncharacterized protein n=1 Tax=Staurois parvus TaxID=386267 RepID=A0ABN9EYW0_9NEOB|nr:unnamed protein product [Staurois parvus]